MLEEHGSGLSLVGYHRLQTAGLVGQHAKSRTEDPAEYHGIDPSDFLDDPYGND